MMKPALLLIFLVICVADFTMGTSPTSAEQQTIIQTANQIRFNAKAANMEEMIWSSDLSSKAEGWVSVCSLTTPAPPGLGLNTWATTDAALDVTKAFTSWSSQQANYHGSSCYNNNCGFWAQLVWSSTKLIGCAYNKCPSIPGDPAFSGGGWLVACLFSPKGNIVGNVPFDTTGAPCTKCASGTGWCSQQGLCKNDCLGLSSVCQCQTTCTSQSKGTFDRNSCKCICNPNYYRNDCSAPCQDGPYCSNSVSTKCSSDPFIIANCPKLCHLC